MSSEAKREPGQLAYETWKMDYEGFVAPVWADLGPGTKESWAAVEQACAVPASRLGEWHRVPGLPLPDGEVDLPDSDVWVLVMTEDSSDYVIARLEFTDDSEGHGEPYWETPGGDLALCNYPFWRDLQLPTEQACAVPAEAGKALREREVACSALADALALPDDHPQRGNLCWLAGRAEACLGKAEWVSVGERLPEPGITVLVWDGDVMMLSEWDRSIWADIRPTHWMPLPSPPKGEYECPVCEAVNCNEHEEARS